MELAKADMHLNYCKIELNFLQVEISKVIFKTNMKIQQITKYLKLKFIRKV